MTNTLTSHLTAFRDDENTSKDFQNLRNYAQRIADKNILAGEFQVLQDDLLNSIGNTLQAQSLKNLNRMIAQRIGLPAIKTLVTSINAQYGLFLNMLNASDIIRAVKYRLHTIYPEYGIQTQDSSFDPGFIKAFGVRLSLSSGYKQACTNKNTKSCGTVDCIIGNGVIKGLNIDYNASSLSTYSNASYIYPSDPSNYSNLSYGPTNVAKNKVPSVLQVTIAGTKYHRPLFQKANAQPYKAGEIFTVDQNLNIQDSKDGSSAVTLEPGIYTVQINPNNTTDKQLKGADDTIYDITCQNITLDDQLITIMTGIHKVETVTNLTQNTPITAEVPDQAIPKVENPTKPAVQLATPTAEAKPANISTEIMDKIEAGGQTHILDLSGISLTEQELQAIIQILKSKPQITEINLSQCGLSQLPSAIGTLTHIKKLNLAYNNLKTIPAQIGQLKNLLSLNLRGNQLTALPWELQNLQNLKDLNIGNNTTEAEPGQQEIVPNNYYNENKQANRAQCIPPNIETLTLSYNEMTAIPPRIRGEQYPNAQQIQSLRHLKIIDIGDCKLKGIPQYITHLYVSPQWIQPRHDNYKTLKEFASKSGNKVLIPVNPGYGDMQEQGKEVTFAP